MAYLGGLDDDERAMLLQMIAHFVEKLEQERAISADLRGKLESCRERIALLETAAYGLL